MTDEFDFDGALEAYEADVVGNNEFGYMNWVQDNAEEIQAALRLAARLQSGEVSEDMRRAGVNNFDLPKNVDVIFEAMAQQLLKEVKDEQ